MAVNEHATARDVKPRPRARGRRAIQVAGPDANRYAPGIASMRTWVHRLTPLLALALLAGAALVLHVELRDYHYEDVRRAVLAIGARNLALAIALTALSHGLLTGYDALALRYLRQAMPYRRMALASFLGCVFSHNVGLPVLGGATPRYRLYASWGLAPTDIALLVGLTAVGFWLGIFAVVGAVLLLDAATLAPSLHVGVAAGRRLGAALVTAVAAYLAASAWRRRPLTVRGRTIPLPPPWLAVAQLALGVADWVVAAAVLYVLLPAGRAPSFLYFTGVFAVARAAAVASRVPGGLGVFETVILLVLAPRTRAPALVGALLAYRAVYYLLPLAIATAILALSEAGQRHARLARPLALVARWLPEVAPRVLAVAIFGTGVVLLFSGAARRHAGRLDWMQHVVPLPLLEVSHFLASLVGLGLVLLASGLQRRLDAAYHLAVVLLGAGAVLVLLKGFDYEESLVLLGMLAALVPCRAEFHRRASLLGERFTLGWAVAVGVALGASVWLGFFVHRHTEYSRDLWWDFSFFGDAPRFLRATVGVVVAVLTAAVWHLLRPAPLRAAPPDADSLDLARAIVATSPVANARLALLADKAFLFSDDRRAFIMYAAVGRSCVAMGDPVGPAASCAELVWQYVELCDRHGTWPVFYEANAATLPLYLDVGLTPLKVGEEARIPLAQLTLEGGAHKQQRYVLRTVEREDVRFEVCPPHEVPPLLPELATISDAWLREKKSREKGFSLGCFDAGYLAQFPIALVRRGGTIVAFANLWCGADREELSPDLMRYVPAAPASVMEYLFLRIMLWAKDEGYRWCNLGMAPLAGLDARAAAPLWNRVAALAFRHGEPLYNFQGLRRFKEKFHPVWRPKYLVYPGGIVLPRVLANVAALISGGLRGVVAK